MNSSYAVVDAIKESLDKPDLHPCAREILEKRLKYHLGRVKRRPASLSLDSQRRAVDNSAKVRAAKAAQKCREILPLILNLRGQGLTYRTIADHLQLEGITNSLGSPYSAVSVWQLVRNNAASGTDPYIVVEGNAPQEQTQR